MAWRGAQVVISNYPEGQVEEVEAQLFPGREGGSYRVPFSRVVYMEQTDFRTQDSKDYYGLAPGKSVMFRWVPCCCCCRCRHRRRCRCCCCW